MGLVVADFGQKDGVTVLRVNGDTKEQVNNYIEALSEAEYDFLKEPKLEQCHKSWTVLLHVRQLEVMASHNENEQKG